jgi:FtsZ-interacting cell division protein ZipA
VDKKTKIIIIVVAVVIIVALIINGVNNSKKSDENANTNTSNTNITYEQDNETGEYIIYNKETGEEITRVTDEAEIKIYEDNPDYDPKLPVSSYEDDNKDETPEY